MSEFDDDKSRCVVDEVSNRFTSRSKAWEFESGIEIEDGRSESRMSETL